MLLGINNAVTDIRKKKKTSIFTTHFTRKLLSEFIKRCNEVSANYKAHA